MFIIFTDSALMGVLYRDPLKRRTQFWVDIYTKYNRNQQVIHDKDRPYIIFRIVGGIRSKYAQMILNKKKYSVKDYELQREKDYYFKLVNNVRQKVCAGQPLKTYEERNIVRLYEQYMGTTFFSRNCQQVIYMRSQQGMRETFIEAIRTSGQYMEKIKIIFESKGVPMEISCLPFVESMFNIRARSKAGASGVWQFIRTTGRRYLRIDSYFDERNSPIKATFAAAKLLRYNFEKTGSWPIAITAYNHGLNGMKRAIKTLGTKDFAVILRNYKSPSFGFASQNFFAEFAAARHVYRNRKYYFGDVKSQQPLRFKMLEVSKPIRIKKFLKLASLDREVFSKLNPDILEKAYKYNKVLPKGFMVMIPRKNFIRFNLAYNKYKRRR